MDLLLRPFGMYSNVNQVINACYLADIGVIEPFYVDGSSFLFRDPMLPGNPWEYYFEQPFADVERTGNVLPAYIDGFITPYYIEPEHSLRIPLPPTDRRAAEKIIARYIRPKNNVLEAYEKLKAIHQPQSKAACLIRGPGKMQDLCGAVAHVHASVYKQTDYRSVFLRALEQHNMDKVILYSDASDILHWFKERLGDLVEWTDTKRCSAGEPHHFFDQGQYQLGLEMIVQAMMMQDATTLIHGISNISNYVMCANPELRGIDVYQPYYERVQLDARVTSEPYQIVTFTRR